MARPLSDAFNPTPWRSGLADDANKEAQRIVDRTEYCAIVVAVPLPQEKDDRQYALLADGDTMYMRGDPVLRSKKLEAQKPDEPEKAV